MSVFFINFVVALLEELFERLLYYGMCMNLWAHRDVSHSSGSEGFETGKAHID